MSPQNHSFPSPNLSIFFFFFFDSDSDLQTEEYGSTIITFLWGILIMLIVRLGSLLDYPSGQVDRIILLLDSNNLRRIPKFIFKQTRN
ncbi:hypothetical protein MRB53_027189 [Persea americana]|uniref:Uncharacterized protein n=1 Tax=Persea americana TaxID=3435 RepID=A0ACC2LL14_PERAE|nr:hypothetical protein MRB53_027189 [Persea americana]